MYGMTGQDGQFLFPNSLWPTPQVPAETGVAGGRELELGSEWSYAHTMVLMWQKAGKHTLVL